MAVRPRQASRRALQYKNQLVNDTFLHSLLKKALVKDSCYECLHGTCNTEFPHTLKDRPAGNTASDLPAVKERSASTYVMRLLFFSSRIAEGPAWLRRDDAVPLYLIFEPIGRRS